MRLSAFDPLSFAAQALTGGSGGGGGGAPSGGATTVSPTIQTAVSPQISPVFIQTGAGSTGSVSAGTSMTAGTTQGVPGRAAPYSDIGYPYSGVPADVAPMPPVLVQGDQFTKYIPYALGALALVIVAAAMKKKKRAAPRRHYRTIGRA